MSKDYSALIDALEERAAYLREADAGDLYWVLIDDAADAIKVLTGQQHLNRILSHGTTDRLQQTLDRLVFIMNVMDHDPDVSVQWIYTEIEGLLSGGQQ
jgi:hypothetical protein